MHSRLAKITIDDENLTPGLRQSYSEITSHRGLALPRPGARQDKHPGAIAVGTGKEN